MVAGVEIPHVAANGSMRAVRVPAGRGTVQLRYSPPGFERGVLVSLGALGVMAILLVGGGLRRRRTRPVPPATEDGPVP